MRFVVPNFNHYRKDAAFARCEFTEGFQSQKMVAREAIDPI